MLQEIYSRRDDLAEQLTQLRADLKRRNGDAYKGCWLDSATNAAGKRYTRLRWFTSLKPQKKGSRILKDDEQAEAQEAIALWGEHAEVTRAIAQLDEQITAIEERLEVLLSER